MKYTSIPRTKVKQEEKAYTPRSQLRTELNQLQLSLAAIELEIVIKGYRPIGKKTLRT